jgi:uncharacterized protein (DUF433 family)
MHTGKSMTSSPAGIGELLAFRGQGAVGTVIGASADLAGGMSFEDVQREYDLTIEEIRDALKLPLNWWNRNNIISCQPELGACDSSGDSR